MAVVEYGEDIILIDMGMGFPEEEMFGVDLVLPDITYLEGKEDRIRGICITHGHEDHIGGLPWLLPQVNAPIYATPLTIGLIKNKLRERNLLRRRPTSTRCRRATWSSLGAFRVEFVHVCHSIPDACLLAVHTPLGTIVHTGDFKLDPTPVDGYLTDYETLARLGAMACSASSPTAYTSKRPATRPPSRWWARPSTNIVANAPGSVIIATFASLISRVQQIFDIAYKHNRKVALLGRSLENNVRVAVELGYLNIPPGVLVDVAETAKLYDNEVLVICTGAQGEPTSALSRIANDDSRYWTAKAGDTYILSATPIPGNETSVGPRDQQPLHQGRGGDL